MMVERKISPARIIIWILLVIGAAASIFPFFWMLIGSTQNPNDVVAGVLKPGNQFSQNWKYVSGTYNVLRFFLNSLKIAAFTVIFGILVNGFAAFGFEKYRSKARERVFAVMLLALILPQIAIVIPLFRLIATFRLLNTHLAIILPSVMSVFIIFFLRQNFKMFPTEIMEAGRVDGAHEFRIFFTLVVPSMKATFTSASIYIFLAQWNSYLWPLMIILNDVQKTLPIALFSMMRDYTIQYGAVMVVVCISTFPILIMFLAMQRQFVQGLLGSVK